MGSVFSIEVSDARESTPSGNKKEDVPPSAMTCSRTSPERDSREPLIGISPNNGKDLAKEARWGTSTSTNPFDDRNTEEQLPPEAFVKPSSASRLTGPSRIETFEPPSNMKQIKVQRRSSKTYQLLQSLHKTFK